MAINFLNTPQSPDMTTVPLSEPALGATAAPDPTRTTSDTEDNIKDAVHLPDDMPWPAPLITTPKLVIRPYHPSDADEIAHIANNPKIARNMTNRFPYPYTIDDSHSFIAKALAPKESNVYAWTISLTADSRPIGGCGLEPGPDVFSRNAEIGYWLGEEHWGKGYASEVCGTLTDWSFEQRGGVSGEGERLLRIGAGVFGGNTGSGKVLRKCEYRLEGTMRGIVWKWGEVRHLEVYGLTREEWEERRKMVK